MDIVFATAANVHKIEDEINTLYQILIYMAPLVGVIFVTYAAVLTRAQRNIRNNSNNIGVVAKATNGKVDQLIAKVDQLHARVNELDTERGVRDAKTQSNSNGGTGTGSTAATGVQS